ncbi:MAG: bifunctional DNA-formamidopyrimidine glycosylase/DNA-(apurinic or apyrimidinic site) lyase [Minisyncoccia bacterium]
MPELPEIETIKRDLNKALKRRRIIDVWTDNLKDFDKKEFEKKIFNQKIEEVVRKGKNIFIIFQNKNVLWFHLKLTGHLLLGQYKLENNKWVPKEKGLYLDRQNLYIHWVFMLDNSKKLVLSDSRRFAKVKIISLKEMDDFEKKLGPDPLTNKFTKEYLSEKLKRAKISVKKFLMDQKYISGIGNIYANEILFEAKINPFRKANSLSAEEINTLFLVIRKILMKAITYRGTSAKDEAYRDLYGRKGNFGKFLKIYQKEGEKCPRCNGIILRKTENNRSTFYCPKCQK